MCRTCHSKQSTSSGRLPFQDVRILENAHVQTPSYDRKSESELEEAGAARRVRMCLQGSEVKTAASSFLLSLLPRPNLDCLARLRVRRKLLPQNQCLKRVLSFSHSSSAFQALIAHQSELCHLKACVPLRQPTCVRAPPLDLVNSQG